MDVEKAVVFIFFLAAALASVIVPKLNNPKQKSCVRCQMTIPGKATICPYCRSKQPLPYGVGCWLAVAGTLAVLMIMILAAFLSFG